MRYLITGGAGFIGSHLTEALLRTGHDVTVIDDLSTGRLANLTEAQSFPNFRIEIESILNETVLDRLISECDAVFHLASAVGVRFIADRPVEVIDRIILGTHALLKVASRYNRKVLITSSSEIYGKNEQVPYREDDDRVLGSTYNSRWSYSDSKAIAEYLSLAYHREKDLPIVIVRLFNTIGPRQSGQYGMVVPRLVAQALKNEPMTVYGDGRQTRCFCYVTDVVRAIIGLMNSAESTGKIFNVGSREEISIMDLAHLIKNISGSNSEIVTVPHDVAYGQWFEDIQRRIPDIDKISRYIGWTPEMKLKEMLQCIIRDIMSKKLKKYRLVPD
jgi:UDP-glucose 4-epimerase